MRWRLGLSLIWRALVTWDSAALLLSKFMNFLVSYFAVLFPKILTSFKIALLAKKHGTSPNLWIKTLHTSPSSEAGKWSYEVYVCFSTQCCWLFSCLTSFFSLLPGTTMYFITSSQEQVRKRDQHFILSSLRNIITSTRWEYSTSSAGSTWSCLFHRWSLMLMKKMCAVMKMGCPLLYRQWSDIGN